MSHMGTRDGKLLTGHNLLVLSNFEGTENVHSYISCARTTLYYSVISSVMSIEKIYLNVRGVCIFEMLYITIIK